MKALFSLLLGLCLVFASPATFAQPTPQPTKQEKQKAYKIAKAGQVAFDAGNYKKALAAFQEAYALSPELKYATSLGQCYSELGQHEEAIDAYTLFLQSADPNHSARPEVEKELLNSKSVVQQKRLSKAEEAFAAGRFEDASALLQEAYSLIPNPEILYKMALCYDELKQYKEALSALNAVLRDDTAPLALQAESRALKAAITEALAIELFASKQHQKALPLFQELYDADAKPERLFDIGRCLEELGQKKEATSAYQTFLEKASSDAPQRASVEAKLKQERQNKAPQNATKIQNPEPNKPTDQPGNARRPGYLFAASGASAGLGVVAGAFALSLAKQAKAAGETRDASTATAKQKQRRVFASAADGLFGAVLVTGSFGLILRKKNKKAEAQTSASVTLAPTGVRLELEY